MPKFAAVVSPAFISGAVAGVVAVRQTWYHTTRTPRRPFRTRSDAFLVADPERKLLATATTRLCDLAGQVSRKANRVRR